MTQEDIADITNKAGLIHARLQRLHMWGAEADHWPEQDVRSLQSQLDAIYEESPNAASDPENWAKTRR